MNDDDSPLMAALKQFEATEANLAKLERLWEEIRELIPSGIQFGSNPDYEDRCRVFDDVLAALPMIDGWKPEYNLLNLNDIAQSRFEAQDIMELEMFIDVEESIEAPGKDLREYRFRFNKKRLVIIQDTLSKLIDLVDSDIRKIKINLDSDIEKRTPVENPYWKELQDRVDQIDTLLGSSIKRPSEWYDLRRHLHFGLICDFHDIEQTDWPSVKAGLRKNLYGVNDPVPVQIKDLSDLVESRPRGPVATRLDWDGLNSDEFERLIFALISSEPGYENPEWLMQTSAPDRGRDLSATRVVTDSLAGTIRSRVIIQCKHWRSRSVKVSDVTTLIGQMKLWEPPRVDVHVIATSGRFTSDAVDFVEKHNQSDNAMRIEMWPESHFERLLAARPSLIAEFRLR